MRKGGRAKRANALSDCPENSITAKSGIHVPSRNQTIPTEVGIHILFPPGFSAAARNGHNSIFIILGDSDKRHGRLLRETKRLEMTDEAGGSKTGPFILSCLN
jgi:hypothetical protein